MDKLHINFKLFIDKYFFLSTFIISEYFFNKAFEKVITPSSKLFFFFTLLHL